MTEDERIYHIMSAVNSLAELKYDYTLDHMSTEMIFHLKDDLGDVVAFLAATCMFKYLPRRKGLIEFLRAMYPDRADKLLEGLE